MMIPFVLCRLICGIYSGYKTRRGKESMRFILMIRGDNEDVQIAEI